MLLDPRGDLTESVATQNVFSKDLLRVIHIADKEKGESDYGVRCLCCSPDGRFVACGDRDGNIWVYRMTDFALEKKLEAHEAEVLSLAFGAAADRLLLISGSRDRLIHVFDATDGFKLMQTLSDHSAAVTSVKFCEGTNRIISCSADRSIVFRSRGGDGAYARYQNAIGQYGTMYDLEVEPAGKLVVTVGQDKKVNMWSVANGRAVRSYKVDSESGEPVKICVDRTGLYCATSSTDKVRPRQRIEVECW